MKIIIQQVQRTPTGIRLTILKANEALYQLHLLQQKKETVQ